MLAGVREVLVTGATGWLGTNLLHGLRGDTLVTSLRAGESIRIRCLVPADQDSAAISALPNVRIVSGDLTNAEDVKRFCADAQGAIVFHLAGVIHPSSIQDFYRVNHQGTVNVLDGARAGGARRVVGVSSNSPFGFNPSPSHRFDERSPYKPYLNYGRSKWLMEQAMFAANDATLETVIVRPPWYYGAYQPPRQTLFYRMVKQGRAPIFGSGENRRSMAYVGNVVSAMLRAATHAAAPGQAYWIADERPYTMREVVETIERVLTEFGYECKGRQPRVPAVVSSVARVADRAMQRAGLYNSKIHVLGEMSETIACSIDKAKREIGYVPEVDLEEGVRRSLRWCADNGIRI